ncbi:hypothetical protein MHBO_001233 [Bonamia ostreae]|uniref:Uncharacterized protein n=1 Tax=Bonamia ostreae TaxID=126728 RepID=A0ABV2AIW2_9EUKA
MEDKRKVSVEEGKKLAKEFNIPFFETSAKNDHNVNEAIQTIVMRIKDKFDNKGKENEKTKGIAMTTNDNKKNCCKF